MYLLSPLSKITKPEKTTHLNLSKVLTEIESLIC